MSETKKIEIEANIEWYQKQYDSVKKTLQEDCSADWYWKEATAEEQMINKLLYMTQLRNMIKGMKQISE